LPLAKKNDSAVLHFCIGQEAVQTGELESALFGHDAGEG
jgi:hypothetical protein